MSDNTDHCLHNPNPKGREFLLHYGTLHLDRPDPTGRHADNIRRDEKKKRKRERREKKQKQIERYAKKSNKGPKEVTTETETETEERVVSWREY